MQPPSVDAKCARQVRSISTSNQGGKSKKCKGTVAHLRNPSLQKGSRNIADIDKEFTDIYLDVKSVALHPSSSIRTVQSSSLHSKLTPTLPSSFRYYLSSVRSAYKPPFQYDYFSVLFREHFIQTFQGIQYSATARPQDPNFVAQNKVALGPNKSVSNFVVLATSRTVGGEGRDPFIRFHPRRFPHTLINRPLPQPKTTEAKKTIIFDLDETLVHCNESLEQPADTHLDITFPTGDTVKVSTCRAISSLCVL